MYFFWSTGADGKMHLVPRIGLQSYFCVYQPANHGKYTPGPVAEIPWQKLRGRRSNATEIEIKQPTSHITFPEDDYQSFAHLDKVDNYHSLQYS